MRLDNTSEIFDRLNRLSKLVDEAEESIRSLQGINHKRYLAPFPNIRRTLAYTNLDANWDSVKERLDNNTMVALENCSEILAVRRVDENLVSQEKLAGLQQDIDALLEKIKDISLPEELERVLINNLQNIREAIRAYQIFGIEGLRKALEGGLYLEYLFRTQEVDGEREQEVVSEARSIRQKAANLVIEASTKAAVSEIVKALAAGGISYLLGSGSGNP